MHLWPSATIRDSFKLAYLRKLEWNLRRMKSEKESSASVSQKLLDGQEGGVQQSNSQQGEVNGKVAEVPNPKAHRVALGLCREILMLLSCCFCCFCCGGNLFLVVSHAFVSKFALEMKFYDIGFQHMGH